MSKEIKIIEQIEEGGTLPLDLLGVHIGQRSEIRR